MNETGIDVFLNVSVDFPEINIVKYEYNTDLLIIEVALTREISTAQEEGFISKASRCINLLHNLEQAVPGVFKIKFKRMAGLTFLRYYRDVKSLREKEINLIISLVREEFYDCLIDEGKNPISRGFLRKQVKRDLLEKLSGSSGGTNYLFAYRDHGRLCMFNR